MKKKTKSKKNYLGKLLSLGIPVIIGTIILGLSVRSYFRIGDSEMVKQHGHSDLINVKDIAKLSVSEFVYNGIAQSLNDKGEPDYNVLYKSTVKVSVAANDIKYTIDEDQKTVVFYLPEFTIENPNIDVDSISLIPNKRNLYMDAVISLCRSDALSETKKSEKLISSAQDNLRSYIEGWYSPILQGYSFEFQFDDAEGGETE